MTYQCVVVVVVAFYRVAPKPPASRISVSGWTLRHETWLLRNVSISHRETNTSGKTCRSLSRATARNGAFAVLPADFDVPLIEAGEGLAFQGPLESRKHNQIDWLTKIHDPCRVDSIIARYCALLETGSSGYVLMLRFRLEIKSHQAGLSRRCLLL